MDTTGNRSTATFKRAVSYLRVSTQAQVDTDYNPQGFSIPSQRQLNEHKAADLKAEIVQEFVEPGGSGRNINRKAMQRMLSFLAEDGHIDYVIVSYIDRFARRLQDHIMLKLEIEKTGAKLVSATENIDDGSSGQLIEGVLAVVAEFQSNHNVKKVKDGLQRKAETGGTPGRAPIGYQNVFEEFEGRTVRVVRIDPERGPIVKWAFEMYATGEWSIRRLTDALDSRGLRTNRTARHSGRPLSMSSVAHTLSNPYYLGFVIHNGAQYPGRHEPLIGQSTFDKVQETLAANLCGEKQRKNRRYLTSTLYCGYCGSRMCFSRNKGRGGTYEYWICLGRQKLRAPCVQRFVAEEAIEDEVIRYWQRVTLSAEKIGELQHALDTSLEAIRKTGAEKITELRHRIGRLRGQERELLSLRYDRAISRELFAEEQQRIATDIASAEREITSYELTDCDYGKLYAMAADLLLRFPSIYAAAPPNVRRQCNRAIFSRLYLKGPKVTGAVLTPLGAGLLEPETGRSTWGRVPSGRNDGPTSDDGLENDLPSTIIFVDGGSRENGLVEVSGLEPPTSTLRT